MVQTSKIHIALVRTDKRIEKKVSYPGGVGHLMSNSGFG